MQKPQETRIQSLSWKDALEEEMVTHSKAHGWKIPWTEESGRLQSMGSQRIGHTWAHTCTLALQCLLYSKVNQLSVHIYPLLGISFPFSSPQSIGWSPLCPTVGSHRLPSLYLVSTVSMCQCQNLSISLDAPNTIPTHISTLFPLFLSPLPLLFLLSPPPHLLLYVLALSHNLSDFLFF